MQTLNQDIKSGQFQPIYLLFGEERYLKKQYKDRIREAVVGDDTMNLSCFEGKGIDVNSLISMADTMPFFSDRRLVLVEDSGFFKGAADAMVDYLPIMPDTTCMVFVETEVDKRSRMFKKVKELGYAAELERQSEEQLARWAAGILSREGRKVTGRTMELFLNMTGDDMENIRMELEKVISYTIGRDVVTDQDVEAVCTVRVTNKIFDMIGAVAGKNPKKAMDLYQDLLTLKEPPMRILFLIARQFNQLLQVKELMGKGMDKNSIAKRCRLQPFVAGKIMSQTRAFTKEQLLEYVKLCVESEEAVKTGKLGDRLAVELLITKR